MRHIFDKRELRRKQRLKIFNEIKWIIADFVIEVFPEYKAIEAQSKTEIIIKNEEGKPLMNLYFVDPYIFVNRVKHMDDISDYIQYEISKLNNKPRFNMIPKTPSGWSVFFNASRNSDTSLDYAIKYEDIDRVKLSKEEYELWLSTRKFGL